MGVLGQKRVGLLENLGEPGLVGRRVAGRRTARGAREQQGGRRPRRGEVSGTTVELPSWRLSAHGVLHPLARQANCVRSSAWEETDSSLRLTS